MKLVVFAHTPPPFHGQSYMVQLMLNSFGGDQRKRAKGGGPKAAGDIECYHVNARVSKSLEDVGGARLGKLVLLMLYCTRALWYRFRYGADTFYYVPAPGKNFALYRDWMVMALCRPFFKHVVFHWHATSMARWLEVSKNIRVRAATYRLLGRADLSIVLSEFNRFNADKLWPRRLAVVPNGIPDPCPDFETKVLPRRRARVLARKKLTAGQPLEPAERAAAGAAPELVRVMFLAHCTREKGLFDAVRAVRLANEHLRETHSPLSLQLVVTGVFPNPAERAEFERLCQEAPALDSSGARLPQVHYAGFVQGAAKERSLLEADILCFPSHWENQPVSVIEALAFGLPVAISRLPSVVEMLPAGYAGIAAVKDPAELATALHELICFEHFQDLRAHFASHFTLEKFASNLSAALKSLDLPAPTPPRACDNSHRAAQSA
jgi:glycosyltransferase involved in cell wall biosynthesis